MKDEVVRRARAWVGSYGIKASQTESKRSKRFAESGAEALSRSRGIHGATGKRGMTPQARGVGVKTQRHSAVFGRNQKALKTQSRRDAEEPFRQAQGPEPVEGHSAS